ncbi:hypothetical protein [Streptomyces sp. NBC_00878]|uniref:hypothetical protein n=1 Tax=Streptomyces sp. NBC_00878 TaxID=2975854 RepID=UPI00225BC4B5|nr:hypothetical protein [Streptomyces sp. NBC_00878]MCX4911873.1 hypothetical protein [Streptomyces sp. NBC_00878]
MPEPTDDQIRRFVADCNARRMGWASFQRSGRRAALRMIRNLPQDTTTITNTEQENQNP